MSDNDEEGHVEVRVVQVAGMDGLLLGLGFLSGTLQLDEAREALVHALKNGLRHDHIVTLYKNLGVVIAEAGIDIGAS